MILLWILAVLVGSTFLAETGFVYVFAAKRLLEDKALPWDFKLIAYFWLIVGFLADIAFNLVRGTIEFRELPRELLFTRRVQRHIGGTGRRFVTALRWSRILNRIDPGHIKLAPGLE